MKLAASTNERRILSRTLTKVKANHFSPQLRRRLGLRLSAEVNLTVEPAAEAGDPWPAIKKTVSPEEAQELRELIGQSRRSRKAPPRVV